MLTSKEDLVNLFKDLGINISDDVMVHCSLKSLGNVINGPLDVIDALLEVVDINKGTILMPAHSGQITDPRDWKNPPLSKKDVDVVRAKMKPFDKDITPSRGRGIVAQTFLSYKNVNRSNHPLNSVSALGKKADLYTTYHDFDEPEGISSPIGRLYSNNGKVLGIGVGVNSFTAIHLAEYIAEVNYLKNNNPSVLFERKNGKNLFRKIKRYPGNSDKFINVLPMLREKKLIKEINFNNDIMTIISIKPVVDRIVEILRENPKFLVT